MTSADVAATQYRDSRNLAARGNLHARYSKVGWFSWLAAQIKLPQGAQVLDVGCGPAWFWGAATKRLPASLHVTLSDISAGMLEEAEQRLHALNHYQSIKVQRADAAALPFPDDSFDAVIAMHMLYHVPSPETAVAEMARILRPGGKLCVTTNGANNFGVINQLRAQAFGTLETDFMASDFKLDRAQSVLQAQFGQADLFLLDDEYIITDPEDVFAYLLSMPPGISASVDARENLRRLIGAAIAEGGGVLKVTRETGLVVATAP